MRSDESWEAWLLRWAGFVALAMFCAQALLEKAPEVWLSGEELYRAVAVHRPVTVGESGLASGRRNLEECPCIRDRPGGRTTLAASNCSCAAMQTPQPSGCSEGP